LLKELVRTRCPLFRNGHRNKTPVTVAFGCHHTGDMSDTGEKLRFAKSTRRLK